MSSEYLQLLEATIEHLQDLQGRGVRHVQVSPDTLAALAKPVSVPPQVRSVPAPPAAMSRPLPAPPEVQRPPQASPLQPAAPMVASPPAPPPPSRAAISPEEKERAAAELRARVLVCTRCPHLVSSRQQVVFGVGSINAALMFVGEAPGADEDAQGEPFVGAAGQLLTKIIQTMGLSRQTVYIANILKCRPNTPGQTSGNRQPTEEEMETCIPHLFEQIELIQPKVLVALGGVAVKGLLHNSTGITRLRGQWQIFRGLPVMPTYHPAYLLRNQALAEKRKVWEDMLAVMEKLGLPISEKQRQYFLRA